MILERIDKPYKIRWTCKEITGLIDKYCNSSDPISYMELDSIDLVQRRGAGREKGYAIFAIRQPGRTIGHIKCNGLGRIIEAEFYNVINNEDIYHRINYYEFKKLINKSIDLLELVKIAFVNNNTNINFAANSKILWFIADFIYHQGCYDDSFNIITHQFRSGYCLHFAMMLKSIFKTGEICWAAPFGHMVYMHDGIPYDIEGVNTSDCDYYIPISYIEEGLKDFTRAGDYFNASEEYIQNAIKRYKEDNKIE